MNMARYLANKFWRETPNVWSQEDIKRVELDISEALEKEYKRGMGDTARRICEMVRSYEDPEDLIEAIKSMGNKCELCQGTGYFKSNTAEFEGVCPGCKALHESESDGE